MFRALAYALLVVSAVFVALPEGNIYSVDKTFIKSHMPASDNFALADDKEDVNEDGAINFQFAASFYAGSFLFVSADDRSIASARLLKNSYADQVYLLHRQLLL